MFWDASAIVPLLLAETRSEELATLLAGDSEFTVWWATPVECLSAIHRRAREGVLTGESLDRGVERLRALVEDADVVAATDDVRERAGRLLATHALRAADSLQLAAALTWSEERPAGERLVCLDDRLRGCARKEGFTVVP